MARSCLSPPLLGLLASAAVLAAPSAAQGIDFYLGPGPNPTGDDAWESAVGSFTVFDFEDGGGPGNLVDTLQNGGLVIDVDLDGIPGNRETSLAFASTAFFYPDVFYLWALLNKTTGSSFHSQITFTFSEPVSAFGVWIYDDSPSDLQSMRLIATDADGLTTQSAVLESGNGYASGVEGFLGVTSDVGLTKVAVECLDEITGLPLGRAFELDFLKIGEVVSQGVDGDVTPDVIFGSGNANGAFTIDRQSGVELGLRGKWRFGPNNLSTGLYNENGDGTYTYNTGTPDLLGPNLPGWATITTPIWSFEWSVNTDWEDTTGVLLDQLTYELGLDFDPGPGASYLAFDQITPTVSVPYYDHSIGDNTTPSGGGTVAVDGPQYASLLSLNNVAQNSWNYEFFNEAPFDTFDPTVPGRYEIYLAAFDGGTEVARTAMTALLFDGLSLSLEGDPCQQDADPGTAGVQVEFELWLRNPDDLEVTGWQAFLEFDQLGMAYVGASSSYASGPFTSHFQSIATAELAPGELRLDGNTFPLLTGPTGDELLATLVFTVSECNLGTVAFDLGLPFDSEASNLGMPWSTALLDSSAIIGDVTPPVISGTPANIVQPADAGTCTEAVVTWTDPTATDNCDPAPLVACTPPSGSTFPFGVTTVTCTATDECGNVSTSTFDVTITATNSVDVVVELPGSMVPTTRCIHFVLDDCGVFADVPLVFTGSPATAVATIEVPCGVWTKLSAKDEQHTKWDVTTLTDTGAVYMANTTLVLDGGDTDNDGDIDINDVTLFLAQFGELDHMGGCPWDGSTKDANFDNGPDVDAGDYPFLTAGWLTSSSPDCMLPSSFAGPLRPDPQRRLRVHDPLTAKVDYNRDGWVDHRDVRMLESALGLSGDLSLTMATTEK